LFEPTEDAHGGQRLLDVRISGKHMTSETTDTEPIDRIAPGARFFLVEDDVVTTLLVPLPEMDMHR
jgi:hypothetical protein